MFGGKCDIISLFILFAKMLPFPFVVTEICKPLPFGSDPRRNHIEGRKLWFVECIYGNSQFLALPKDLLA